MSASPHWEAERQMPATRQEIMEAVCEACACRPRDILSHNRQAEMASARKLLTLLLRDELDLSFMAIAQFMDRDHTTCMYNYTKAKELLSDPTFAALRQKAAGPLS